MRTRLTPRGLPDHVDDPTIGPVIERLRKSLEEQREAESKLEELRVAREAALEADREALAVALAKGRRDPGPKHAETAEQAFADASRKAEAYELLVGRLEAELTAAVSTQGHAFIAAQAESQRQLAEELLEAIDALEAAGAKLNDAMSLRNWVRGYPRPFATAKGPAVLARLQTDLAAGVTLGDLRHVVASLVEQLGRDQLRESDAKAWARGEVIRRLGERCTSSTPTWRCSESEDLELMTRSGQVLTEIAADTDPAELVLVCPEHRRREQKVAA